MKKETGIKAHFDQNIIRSLFNQSSPSMSFLVREKKSFYSFLCQNIGTFIKNVVKNNFQVKIPRVNIFSSFLCKFLTLICDLKEVR